jgi:hypothetical protein
LPGLPVAVDLLHDAKDFADAFSVQPDKSDEQGGRWLGDVIDKAFAIITFITHALHMQAFIAQRLKDVKFCMIAEDDFQGISVVSPFLEGSGLRVRHRSDMNQPSVPGSCFAPALSLGQVNDRSRPDWAFVRDCKWCSLGNSMPRRIQKNRATKMALPYKLDWLCCLHGETLAHESKQRSNRTH